MAYIIETPNAFEPLTNVVKHVHEGGITIMAWLKITKPGFEKFEVPTVCLINGEAVLQKDWNTRVIQPKDIVNLVALPTGPFLLIAAVLIALIAATIAISLSIQAPVTPGEIPASDPVFSTKGQQNTIRLGEPIEVNYGRNRIFPSLAARPYFQYKDNDQYQYSLFCIGQGEYDIESIQIGDTSIDEFQEVEYEVLGPGEPVTLFPANVFTSAEAGDQTLFAPNEDDYTGDGWVGPFPTNPSGTEANQIQVDLVFPKGIYAVDDSGTLLLRSISVEIEMREIDDTGAPIGVWLPFTSPSPKVFSGGTTTPQRKTIVGTMPPGRFEIRMRRTDTKDTSYRAGHEVVWEGLRAYINVEQDYGNVTLLAVIIRATNNLNERTQLKFNVIGTRKLPIASLGSSGVVLWSEPTATRSIVWATVDIFKSAYGGRILSDSFFDWSALIELDDLYTSRGDYFDWIFRDPITVWEAAKTVLRAGRAIPLLAGSLITAKRDGPLEVPVTFFTPDNIIEKTFEWDVKLWSVDEYDSVRIEYTEPATGYKQETVLCTLPGGTTDNPQDVRLPGVQSRAQAYREGLYMLAVAKYLRENITFETGLEGHIPTFGDLVAVAHDVPRWGQRGYVVHAVKGTGENYHLTVSEPLDWTDTGEHQILLRGRQGEPIGPLSAFQTEDPQQVIVTIPGDSSTDGFDFMLGGTSEPMLFVFGVGDRITKYAKVVSINPQGGEKIRVTLVNDNPVIHSFDELDPPPLEEEVGPPQVPDLPVVDNLVVTQLDGPLRIVQIAWTASFGAQYYVVQTSEDGENWTNQGTTVRTAIQVQVRPGDLWVRVAGVNTGQGPWTEAFVSVNVLGAIAVSEPWSEMDWSIQWWEVLNAVGYRVSVYDATASDPVLKRTEDLGPEERSYQYTYAKALADSNLVREMLVTVDVLFGNGAANQPVETLFTNSLPPAPTGPNYVDLGPDSALTEQSYQLQWSVPVKNDLVRVAVWLSPVAGFDPSVEIPVYDETVSVIGSTSIPTSVLVTIPLDSTGTHPAYYWRVALFDVWGDEISTNVSAQQVIPAIP